MALSFLIFTFLLVGDTSAAGNDSKISSELGKIIATPKRKRKLYQGSLYIEGMHGNEDQSSLHDNLRHLSKSYVFSYDKSLSFSYSLSYEYPSNVITSNIDLPKYSPSVGSDYSTVKPMPPQSSESQTDPNFGKTSSAENTSDSPVLINTKGQNFNPEILLPIDTDLFIDQSNMPGNPPRPDLFFTCNSEGEFSSDAIDSSLGAPPSGASFDISYSYSAVSVAEGMEFVYTLESEIFNTMASSLLDCNRVRGRGLNYNEQQENRRVLAEIHALEYTGSKRVINALGQCEGEDIENAYCFTVDSSVSLLLENEEGDEASIIGAAISALSDVQKSMNDGTYADAIPSLEKVTLLRSDPEITASDPPSYTKGATPIEIDEESPSPKTSSISLGSEQPLKKSNDAVVLLSTSFLAFMGVGLAFLTWLGARRCRRHHDCHVELIDDELEPVPPSISSISDVDELEIRHSHIHPIDFPEESAVSSDVDWDFSRVTPIETSSSGTYK